MFIVHGVPDVIVVDFCFEKLCMILKSGERNIAAADARGECQHRAIARSEVWNQSG